MLKSTHHSNHAKKMIGSGVKKALIRKKQRKLIDVRLRQGTLWEQ